MRQWHSFGSVYSKLQRIADRHSATIRVDTKARTDARILL